MIIGLSHSVLADFSVNNEGFIKPFHKPSLGLICSASRFHFYWILVEGSGAARGKKMKKFEKKGKNVEKILFFSLCKKWQNKQTNRKT